MQHAKRLGLAMLLLSGAFLVLIAIAASSLWAAGQAATSAILGLIGVLAAITVLMAWRVAGADELEVPEQAPECKPTSPELVRAPVRIQTMPVAELPPAYLEAVMKGAQARLTALKAQSTQPSSACK
jgi:uncharacterized protein (DUF58 family)